MSTGSEVLEALAGKDLNKDGKIINLIVCGNSKFYDFSFFEDEMNMWCKYNGYPDVVILGEPAVLTILLNDGPTTTTSPSPCSRRLGTHRAQTEPKIPDVQKPSPIWATE